MEDDKSIVSEPVGEYGMLDLNKSYTYLDYLKWEFDERLELIKGKIKKMAPAPSRTHQTTSMNLIKLLIQQFDSGNCQIYHAPFDVRLPIPNRNKVDTVIQPDLCVVCDESILDDAGCNGVPDLMVEILSPSYTKHDLSTKYNLYEEVGVQEYWVINPLDKTAIVYSLVNGEYQGSRFYVEGTTLTSKLFPELVVDIELLFQGVG